uniref:HDC09452 n=1 Tax=Drosophila melanogaster TaxID=7227 RepID=Q6ILH1_DROME|nr:TPA_inf: HDC09452 [Drosophila melanogaster]
MVEYTSTETRYAFGGFAIVTLKYATSIFRAFVTCARTDCFPANGTQKCLSKESICSANPTLRCMFIKPFKKEHCT